MDRLIERFEEMTSSQKMIVTAGMTLLVLLFIGALYILTAPKIENPKAPNSFQDSVATPTPVVLKMQPVKPWPVYTGSAFELSYPPDATVTSGVVGGQGEALLIEGKEGGTDYNIELQITDATQTPLNNIYAIFRGLEYKEEETTLKNVIAKKFSGSVAGTAETAIVFESRGKVYKIQLFYNSPQINTNIEQIFQGILSTFKLI